MKGPAFLLFSLSCTALIGANTKCAPEPPATCYPDDCCRTYCLGPTNEGINAIVRPYTCNGDWVITAAGLYWNSHIDGMEYAVETQVNSQTIFPDLPLSLPERVNIIDGKYKNPDFKWDFGFKFGLGYNTTCDGWDIGAVWTHYHGKASSHDEAEIDDNKSLLPLWSDFNSFISSGSKANSLFLPIYATNINTQWNLQLDLLDIELGCEFWTTRRLTLRPHVGLRYALIKQHFEIEHKGGTFSEIKGSQLVAPARINTVDLENDFKGLGVRCGLDSVWNFGCGWAIFGNSAFSILYGHFHVDHNEADREAIAPFSKTKLYEAKDFLRVSRYVADLVLGIQWSSLFCDCQYAFAVKLGWENHIFFDQNQLWRVNKLIGSTVDSLLDSKASTWNNFFQRRGNLDTQGWTLTFVFDF